MRLKANPIACRKNTFFQLLQQVLSGDVCKKKAKNVSRSVFMVKTIRRLTFVL